MHASHDTVRPILHTSQLSLPCLCAAMPYLPTQGYVLLSCHATNPLPCLYPSAMLYHAMHTIPCHACHALDNARRGMAWEATACELHRELHATGGHSTGKACDHGMGGMMDGGHDGEAALHFPFWTSHAMALHFHAPPCLLDYNPLMPCPHVMTTTPSHTMQCPMSLCHTCHTFLIDICYANVMAHSQHVAPFNMHAAAQSADNSAADVELLESEVSHHLYRITCSASPAPIPTLTLILLRSLP